MKIIAKTDMGFLIEATKSEVSEILRSVNGSAPDEIIIGHKIPAIDYAATITKLKKLPDEYAYKQLFSYAEDFSESLKSLSDAVNKATEINN